MVRKVKIYVKQLNKEKVIRINNETLHKTYCGECHKKGVKTPYKYKNGEVICPVCGNTLTVVKTPEEYEAEALKNLHLSFVGKDYSTGIDFYTLSGRVDYNVWNKIKKYFTYHNKSSEYDDTDFAMSEEPGGWITAEPEKVENVLIELGVMKQ